VSKVRNYGGDFEIAREVTLLDDRFEVVLLEGKTTFSFVPYFAGMAVGKLESMRGATVLRAREMKVCSPGGVRVHVQIDGEYAGQLPANLRIVPEAIRLLVPPGYGESKASTPKSVR
jgi:diacylglycerol kinase family enzyme